MKNDQKVAIAIVVTLWLSIIVMAFIFASGHIGVGK